MCLLPDIVVWPWHGHWLQMLMCLFNIQNNLGMTTTRTSSTYNYISKIHMFFNNNIVATCVCERVLKFGTWANNYSNFLPSNVHGAVTKTFLHHMYIHYIFHRFSINLLSIPTICTTYRFHITKFKMQIMPF